MDPSHPPHSPDVLAYLARIFDEGRREFACRASMPEEVAAWQADARPALRKLLKLDDMETELADHEVAAELGDIEDLGDCTRQRGRLMAEPNVWIPFWLLKPKGDGPFPLAITPHGHDPRGHDTSAGVAHDDASRKKMADENRDVAVQAAARGYLAIAPATRGIGCNGVPDVNKRHNGRNCHSQAMHCLAAGRTAMGERCWDMERFIDWALASLPVHECNLLMLGNSGGGMVTNYAAAVDVRVQIAIPSCSFAPFVRPTGPMSHCDCNIVPGIMRWGEIHDVAGLIAPRRLLIVHGQHDALFVPEQIDQSVARVQRIYEAAGVPEHFQHAYGPGGHRFYGDIMWSFVAAASKNQSRLMHAPGHGGPQARRPSRLSCSAAALPLR